MRDTTEGMNGVGGGAGDMETCHEDVVCADDEYCSYVFSKFRFECEKKAPKDTRCWRNEKCISGDCSYSLGILFWACTSNNKTAYISIYGYGETSWECSIRFHLNVSFWNIPLKNP